MDIYVHPAAAQQSYLLIIKGESIIGNIECAVAHITTQFSGQRENNRPVLAGKPHMQVGATGNIGCQGAAEVFKRATHYKLVAHQRCRDVPRGSGGYRQHLIVSTQGGLEVIFQYDAPGEVDRSADTGSSHAAIRSQNTVINGNRAADIYAQAGQQAVYRTEVRNKGQSSACVLLENDGIEISVGCQLPDIGKLVVIGSRRPLGRKNSIGTSLQGKACAIGRKGDGGRGAGEEIGFRQNLATQLPAGKGSSVNIGVILTGKKAVDLFFR